MRKEVGKCFQIFSLTESCHLNTPESFVQIFEMLNKGRKKRIQDPSLHPSRTTPKPNGVYSGPRPILHPSFKWKSVWWFADKPINQQADTEENIASSAELIKPENITSSVTTTPIIPRYFTISLNYIFCLFFFIFYYMLYILLLRYTVF